LKDAQVAATTKAGADGRFEVALTGITGGSYIFGVWAEDSRGNRSITHTFPIAVTTGATTVISGIFLPPTITTDKLEVKKGDTIAVIGSSAPNADVIVLVHSDEEIPLKTKADKDGSWISTVDTLNLDLGDHTARARASADEAISIFSKSIGFKVGTKNVVKPPEKKCPARGDVNGDCKVNLVDFSIVAYWYKRQSPPAKVDVNGDGIVNLTDVSIMAYYWTG
jgi:hypothetical protein